MPPVLTVGTLRCERCGGQGIDPLGAVDVNRILVADAPRSARGRSIRAIVHLVGRIARVAASRSARATFLTMVASVASPRHWSCPPPCPRPPEQELNELPPVDELFLLGYATVRGGTLVTVAR